MTAINFSLSTVLAASNKFWYVIFSFSHSLKRILIYPVISFLLMAYVGVCLISKYCRFSKMSNSIPCGLRTHFVWFKVFCLYWDVFVVQHMASPRICYNCTWKECVFWRHWVDFSKDVRSVWWIIWLLSFISLLIFYQAVLSFTKRGVLKSVTIIFNCLFLFYISFGFLVCSIIKCIYI